MKRLLVPLAAALTILLAGSCSIRQELQLDSSGAGSIAMRISLQKLFVDYVTDLSELTGEQNHGKVFDLESIRRGFAEREDLKLTRIASPTPEVLEMELAFRSIEQIFAGARDMPGQPIVSFGRSGDTSTLRFHLDRGNFAQVTAFLPFLQSPLFEGLGPQEGDDTTEAEYLELIDLALGDGGAEALKASTIETRVTVKGSIVAHSGGTLNSGGSSVSYKIPLVRVLLLDKPLDYSLSFK